MRKILLFVARVVVFTLVYLVLTDIGNLVPAIVNAISHTDTALMWVVNMLAGGAIAGYIRFRKLGERFNVFFVALGFLFGVVMAEMAWHWNAVWPKLVSRVGWQMFAGIGIAFVAFLSLQIEERKK